MVRLSSVIRISSVTAVSLAQSVGVYAVHCCDISNRYSSYLFFSKGIRLDCLFARSSSLWYIGEAGMIVVPEVRVTCNRRANLNDIVIRQPSSSAEPWDASGWIWSVGFVHSEEWHHDLISWRSILHHYPFDFRRWRKLRANLCGSLLERFWRGGNGYGILTRR